MKTFFKPANIAFYILMLLLFFVLGLYFAGYIEAGKNQGLAGGAIVLGYGVLFGGLAFIASFFIAHFVNITTIKKINWILLIILFVTCGYKYYQFSERDREQKERSKEFKPAPTSPTKVSEAVKEPTAMLYNDKKSNLSNTKVQTSENTMGMGYFLPNFYENNVLHFYGNLNLEKPLTDHTPYDSITFQRNKYNQFEIASAPPWLIPEVLKLDYDMLYFKLVSITEEFAEVEVNANNSQTAFVNKRSGKLMYWPEFLLGMHSVEFYPENNEKVRDRPFKEAGVNNVSHQFMHPIKIKEDWMEVILWDNDFKKVGKGWIQWKRDGNLLILYNLLS